MSRLPLAREGYPHVGVTAAVTIVFFLLGWSCRPGSPCC
jgi:hypothetical protein